MTDNMISWCQHITLTAWEMSCHACVAPCTGYTRWYLFPSHCMGGMGSQLNSIRGGAGGRTRITPSGSQLRVEEGEEGEEGEGGRRRDARSLPPSG